MRNLKTKHLFGIFAVVSIAGMALALGVTKGIIPQSIFGEDKEYTMELDSSNAPTDFEVGTYGREGMASNAIVKGDYSLDMTYRLAKRESGYHVTLAPHGYMYNQVDSGDTYSNRITSLKSISVTYTSSSNISLRTSIRNDGKEFGDPVSVTSDTPINFTDYPYYFMLEAGDAAAQISKVTLTYSCSPNDGVYVKDMAGEYTGTGNDGFIYKLTISGNTATYASLNKQTNVSYSGTVTAEGSNLVSSFNIQGNAGQYVSSVSADHRVLTYSSKSGVAAAFPEITFYKVYKVEDFERFSSQGQTFGGKVGETQRNADSLYDMSGLRSQWHSDWYTSNSLPVSYFGDSNWKVMGSTDFLLYTSDKGHNSSKAAAFKGNNNGLRHIQMKAPLGLPNIIGKGSYLSFWAKAYSNSGLSTVKTTDSSIKVYAFYNNPVTKSNVGTRTDANITIPANSDWARYTIPLDNTKEYYSIGFYDNKGSQIYLVVDDIEIYSVNPYAEYVPPVAVTGVTLNKSSDTIVVGETSTLTATVAPSNATNKTVSWSSSNTNVATVSNGVVTAIAAGSATITVTTADGGFTATCNITASTPLISGTFYTQFSYSSMNFNLVIALGSKGQCDVRISNASMNPTSYTYNASTKQVTIATTGSYSGYSLGTVTATFDEANNRLTGLNCTGNIKSALSNKTVPAMGSGSDSILFSCSDDASTLRNRFKRRYQSESQSSWAVSPSDRINSNTTNYVTGSSSLQVNGYGGNSLRKVGLNLQNDINNKTYKSMGFWVYNPSNSDIGLDAYVYKAASLNSACGFASFTAVAGEWTWCCSGIGSKEFTVGTNTLYNFQIYLGNNATNLCYDEICFYI